MQICDEIDPDMTFAVPLAAGIVERRGGVLSHGAIIAREYGLSCVTGVPHVTELIQKNLKIYGAQADLKRVRVSPHTFRHTFAVNFVRNGGDPFTLQKILGHSSLETTGRHCELAEEDVLRRHRKLTPLSTMDLKLSSSKRIPRSQMKDW